MKKKIKRKRIGGKIRFTRGAESSEEILKKTVNLIIDLKRHGILTESYKEKRKNLKKIIKEELLRREGITDEARAARTANLILATMENTKERIDARRLKKELADWEKSLGKHDFIAK